MQNCKRFLKQEPVFVIAAVCAVVSMLWVPPSAQYLEYIDLRVLELLFCLMAAVAGMQQEGTFLVLSQRMLAGRKSSRLLTLSLVMLPFFASMLITNDVALITFVPFAVLVLQLTNQMQRLAWVVTLQTIAANIGSMLTPVGNPQNLYLSSFYGMDAASFFAVTIPVVALSFCLLAICCLWGKNRQIEVRFEHKEVIRSPKRLTVFLALFGLSLLSVLHLVGNHLAFLLTVLILLVASTVRYSKRWTTGCWRPLSAFLSLRGIWELSHRCSISGKCYGKEHHVVRGGIQPGHQQCAGSGAAVQFYPRCKGDAAGNQHRRSGDAGGFAGKPDFF